MVLRKVIGKSREQSEVYWHTFYTFDVLECGHMIKHRFMQFVPNADADVVYRDGETWRRCSQCGPEGETR